MWWAHECFHIISNIFACLCVELHQWRYQPCTFSQMHVCCKLCSVNATIQLFPVLFNADPVSLLLPEAIPDDIYPHTTQSDINNLFYETFGKKPNVDLVYVTELICAPLYGTLPIKRELYMPMSNWWYAFDIFSSVLLWLDWISNYKKTYYINDSVIIMQIANRPYSATEIIFSWLYKK